MELLKFRYSQQQQKKTFSANYACNSPINFVFEGNSKNSSTQF